MKFRAKLRFKGEKNAKYLIRAFFQDFNDESSIVIRGKEAEIEIVFDNNPPMEIIKSLEHCDVIEIKYGKDLAEYIENKTEYQALEEKICNHAKETKNTIETVKVPELETIAEKATDFKHFVELVIESIELEQKQDLLENFVIAATEVDKISWKSLEKNLKNRGIIYRQWEKIYISKQVSEKFFDYSITILPFFYLIKQYKNYSFGSKQEENSDKQQEIILNEGEIE